MGCWQHRQCLSGCTTRLAQALFFSSDVGPMLSESLASVFTGVGVWARWLLGCLGEDAHSEGCHPPSLQLPSIGVERGRKGSSHISACSPELGTHSGRNQKLGLYFHFSLEDSLPTQIPFLEEKATTGRLLGDGNFSLNGIHTSGLALLSPAHSMKVVTFGT